MVDRKAGLASLAKIRHRTAKEVTAAILRIIKERPDEFKTLTFDKGSVFGEGTTKLAQKLDLMCLITLKFLTIENAVMSISTTCHRQILRIQF